MAHAGVVLRLSTAEPTVHGTPPVLGLKTVSVKAPPQPPAPMYRNPGVSPRRIVCAHYRGCLLPVLVVWVVRPLVFFP